MMAAFLLAAALFDIQVLLIKIDAFLLLVVGGPGFRYAYL